MTFRIDTTAGMGTYLQGYIRTTRDHIESVFGAPPYDVADEEEKVTTEWTIVFDNEDGAVETFTRNNAFTWSHDSTVTVATIYDWKRYDLGQPYPDEMIVWNVGGHSEYALERVAEALGLEPEYRN